MATSEMPLIDAAQLAIEEINQSGGILGRPIQPIIVDGASSPIVFSAKTKQLIFKRKVTTLFGCWTSDVRKALIPTLEKYNVMLWYPLQYEGLESSRNVFYTGTCPNQQIAPALNWLLRNRGKRLFFIGSDYVFPRTVHQMMRAQFKVQGGEIVDECFIPLESDDFSTALESIQALQPDAIFSTLNGDSGLAFYKQYHRAGLNPEDIPILAVSIGEDQLLQVGDAAVGHHLVWNYFQGIETPENQAFVQRFRARYGAERVISAPMVSAYSQIYLWKQAVELAGSFDVDKVRIDALGESFASPEGMITLGQNHHVSHHYRIGTVQRGGWVKIMEESDVPLSPQPWLGIEGTHLTHGAIVRQLLGEFSKTIQQKSVIEQKSAELEEIMVLFEEQILERKRAEQELRRMLSISQAMSQAVDLNSALANALAQISEFTTWPYGEVWFPNAGKTHLRTGEVWHLEDSLVTEEQGQSLKLFRHYTETTSFRIDEGFVGAIYESGETQWTKKFGIYGAVGVPILSPLHSESWENGLQELGPLKESMEVNLTGRKVLAVLVFLLPEEREEDQRLIELVSAVATQLGTFVQQKKAEEALRYKNQQLGTTLCQLKQTQGELVQSEKMAALGQLVAGVAHEINTPLGAICSSSDYIADFLAQDLEKLPYFFRELSEERQTLFIQLFHQIRRAKPLSNRERRQARREILRQLEAVNAPPDQSVAELILDLRLQEQPEIFLPLLQDEGGQAFLETLLSVGELCNSSRDISMAAGRASKVIFALKTYASYENGGTFHPVNLADSLESVLSLYSGRFKNGVQLVRNYGDRLPCLPGHREELNQVWMNLIHNALQAMEEKGTLLIEIRNLLHALEVSITDSGSGIPPNILPKIFDPFFTTKPTGEGSGLGLDIARKIVQNHQGNITVDSVPGRTTFTVILPLKHQDSSSSDTDPLETQHLHNQSYIQSLQATTETGVGSIL